MTNPSGIPADFVASVAEQKSSFDVDILDDDKELWLIRIPENVDPKDLVSAKFRLPSQTSHKALCKLQKGPDSYAMYRVPQPNDVEREEGDNEELDSGISGQEMAGFSCLVPAQAKDGKRVFAPKPFKHWLIMDEEVTIPDSTDIAQSILNKPVTKREHPEGLKMRYKPIGYVPAEDMNTAPAKKDTKVQKEEKEGKKAKRRRGEDDKDRKKKKKE